MSGGSLGYVQSQMQDDALVAHHNALRALPERLAECLAQPVVELHGKDAEPDYRPITERERADAQQYGARVLRQMRDLLAVIDDLHRRARVLAPIAEMLDYLGSGDVGNADVWEAVLNWGRACDAQLTLDTITPDHVRALRCVYCNQRAACVGAYEDEAYPGSPACDTCCGHGCEDGSCDRLFDLDAGILDTCLPRVVALMRARAGALPVSDAPLSASREQE